jgi:hypothetical protein
MSLNPPKLRREIRLFLSASGAGRRPRWKE